MLTKGDITDIICEHLPGLSGSGGVSTRPPSRVPSSGCPAASRPLPRRVFISDWELKKLYKPGQKTMKVPSNAIISPLAQDWLDYNGVEVLRD